MNASRLTMALEQGAFALPKGAIGVFDPPPGYDLSSIPRENLVIVTRVCPDAEAWERAGFRVVREVGDEDLAAAVVVLPRAKDAARARIAEAARLAPLVIVDGQKHDGIDSILKAVRAVQPPEGVISKAHGKLFWFTGGDFSGWAAKDRFVDGFVTRPGVFSADGPDKASQALRDALPRLSGRVCDLGAGWGYLARAILASPEVTALDLVEADAVALDCARRNVTDPRATFAWADATTFTPPAPYDTIVSNPPFHVGRAGDPALGKAFIAAAARMLRPGGDFWMVANRHLPYEESLDRAFSRVEEVAGTPGFKVLHASSPRRARR